LDKILAIVRSLIIARQFGLTATLDVFNVANNVPDLLFALISGGALAMAIIPVLSEVLTKKRERCQLAGIQPDCQSGFLVTAGLSLIVAVFADILVRSPFGIAPGFNAAQQTLVVSLMRLDLIVP